MAKPDSNDPEAQALCERLREMVDVLGTQGAAAKVGRISPRQLRSYLSGESVPSFLVVSRMARAAGFNPNYVMVGDGPRLEVPVDEALIPIPSNMGAYLELRRELLLKLLNVYEDTSWPMPEHGDEDLLMADSFSLIADLSAKDWHLGIQIAAEGHRAAVAHIRRTKARLRNAGKKVGGKLPL